jgi:hypothetical protein
LNLFRREGGRLDSVRETADLAGKTPTETPDLGLASGSNALLATTRHPIRAIRRDNTTSSRHS